MSRTTWCTCILLLALGCAVAPAQPSRPPRVERTQQRPQPPARLAEAPNSTLQGTVARVVDGDTLRVDLSHGQERVRLIGMDTPEMRPEQPFAREATRAVEELCPPGTVLKLKLDVQPRDRHQRLLAYVYLPDGRMLNEELLRQGLATVMTIPPNVRHAEEFLRLQREARAAGKGLWGRAPGTPGEAALHAPGKEVECPPS